MNYFDQKYEHDNESTADFRDLVPLIFRVYTFYLKTYTFIYTLVATIDKL